MIAKRLGPGRHNRRAFRLLSAVLVLVLAVLGLGVGALHLPIVQNSVWTRAVDSIDVAYGVAMSATSFRYDLFDMEFEVGGLSLRSTGRPDLRAFVQADRVVVDLNTWDLVSGLITVESSRVEGLSIVLESDADGQTNLPDLVPSSPETVAEGDPIGFELRELTIAGTRFEFVDARTDASIDVPAWEMTLSGTNVGSMAFAVSVSATAGTQVLVGDIVTGLGELGASLVIGPDAIDVEAFSVASDGLDLSVTGAISDLAAPVLDLDLTARLRLDRLAEILGLPQELVGDLDAQAAVSGGLDDLAVRGRAAGVDLTFREFTGLDVSADFAWARAAGHVELEAVSVRSPMGGVDATGQLGLVESVQTAVDIEVSDLDLAALGRMFDGPVEVASRATGRLHIEFPGTDVGEMVADGQLRLDRTRTGVDRGVVPLSGTVGVAWDGEVALLDLQPLVLDTLTADGRFRLLPGNAVDATIDAGADDVARLIAGIRRLTGQETGESDAYPSGAVDTSLVLSGTLADPRLAFTLDAASLDVESLLPGWMPVALAASGEYASGRIDLNPARVTLNGQTIEASGSIGLDPGVVLDLGITGRDNAIEALLAGAGRDAVPVQGRIDVDSIVRGTVDAVIVGVQATGVDVSVYGQSFDTARVEVTLDREQVEIHDLVMTRPGSGTEAASVSASGTYGWDSTDFALALAVRDLDVRDLPFQGGDQVQGRVDLDAGGSGSLANPSIDAVVSLTDAAYGGVQLGEVGVNAVFVDSRLEADVDIPMLGLSGALEVLAADALPATAEIDIAGLDVGPLASALGWTRDLSGQVTARIDATGDLTDWANATARVAADPLDWTIGGQRVQSDTAVFTFADQHLEFVPFTIRVNDQELMVGGQVPVDPASGPGMLSVVGALDVAVLSTLLGPDSGLRAGGVLSVDLGLSGTTTDFSTSGSAEWRNGRLEVPGFSEPLDPVQARLNVVGDELVLDSLTAVWSGAELAATGRLPLAMVRDLFGDTGSARPALLEASIDNLGLRSIPGIPEGVDGSVDIVLDAQADGWTLDDLTVRARLPRMELSAAEIDVAPGSEIVVRIANRRAVLEPFILTGPGTVFRGDGELGLAAGSDIRLDVTGQADTTIFASRIRSVASSGQLDLDFRLRGTTSAPEASGNVRVSELSFLLESPLIEGNDFSASFALTPETITLENLTGLVNDGAVNASGRIDYTGSDPFRVQMDLSARDLYVEVVEGLGTVSNADLTVRSSGALINVGGAVQLVEGTYTQDVDLAGLLRNAVSPGAELLPGDENPVLSRIRYDVPIETLDPVVVDNNVAELQADVAVRLTGSYYQPGLVGRVFVNEGGTIELRETEFVLDAGVIDFLNPNRVEPSLNLTARTSTSGYDVTLELTGGGSSDLEAVLSSTPDLPEPEIVALLLTGRTLDSIRGSELNVAREQALSYATGALGGRISRSAQETLGLSRVSIQPNLIANESDPGARLTVGQDLTRNLELIYSMDLTDSGDQIWIAEYDIRRGLVTRSVKQEDNTYRFELRHDLTFGGPQTASRTGRSVRTIGTIRFEPESFGSRDFADVLGLDSGDRYDPIRFRERQRRVRDDLVGRGYLETRINVSRETDGDTVNIVFRVSPGPQVQFEYSGTRVANSLRESIAGAWSSGTFDAMRIRTSLERIRAELVGDGFLDAEVGVEIDDSPVLRTVRFSIDPGTVYSGLQVTFEGADGRDADSLRQELRRQGLWTDLVLNPERVRTFLVEHYRANAYLDASVSLPALQLDPAAATARVTIPVVEGPEYRVGRMVFRGNQRVPDDLLSDGFGSAGRVFRPAMLDAASDLVYQNYWNRGFSDVVLTRALMPDPATGTVDFSFTIEENAQDIISAIEVVGNRYTSSNLVATHLNLEPGDPVRIDELTRTRRSLYDTGAYSLVDVETIDVDDPAVVGPGRPVLLRFNVREVAPYSVRYGGFYDTERGVGGIVDVQNRNSLGDARALGVRARYDSHLRELRTYLSQPVMFGLPLKSDTSLFFSRELETAFINDSVGVSIQQETRLGELYLLSYGYSFEHNRTYDRLPDGSRSLTVPPEVVNVAPLIATLTRDTRDDILDASRGAFMSHSLEFAPSFLGSDGSLVRYFGQWFRYRPISEPTEIPYSGGVRKSRFVYAAGVRLGLASGLGGDVPLSRRFFAGGGTTIRGFDQDRVGPLDREGPIPMPAGGGAVLLLNNEVRFPIFNIFDGVAFLDAGNVYRTVTDFDPWRLRSSSGFGLRIRTPYFLLRADYGFNLNPRPDEQRSTFFFSIGQAF